MPTYDYECDACSHSFELFQSITAEPEKKCPECGKRKLRRLIGPGAAIVFKGSGFYKTDSRGVASATADSGPSSEPVAAASDHGHSHPHTDSVDTGPAEAAAAG